MLGLWLLFPVFASLVACLDIHGSIKWNDACAGIEDLRNSRAILDHGSLFGGIRQDGGFIIHGVTKGTYILSIHSHNHAFDQLRVDINEATPNITVRPYTPGSPLNPPSSITLQYPIVLSAKKKINYFTPAQSFNLISFLSNPMMLLMIVGGGLAILMPYLMKNIDPEAIEEFRREQTKLTTGGSSFSALMNVGSGQPAAQPAVQSAPRNRGGNKNKRR